MENEIVLLRALEPVDLDFIYQIENDSDNFEFGDSSLSSLSKFTLSNYIENSHQNILEAGQFRWVIVSKEDDKSVGIIDLYEYDAINRRAGVGIILHKDFRNNGFASNALQLIISYSKNKLNLHQLFCQIEEGNKSSISLFEKFKFEKTGEFKDWNIRASKKFTVNLYQLILPD